MLQAVTFIVIFFFICYICYFFMLRGSDGASDPSDVRALVAPNLETSKPWVSTPVKSPALANGAFVRGTVSLIDLSDNYF